MGEELRYVQMSRWGMQLGVGEHIQTKDSNAKFDRCYYR